MSAFLSTSSGFSGSGWRGYAREFLHINDPCGGSATLVTETVSIPFYTTHDLLTFDPEGEWKSTLKGHFEFYVIYVARL